MTEAVIVSTARTPIGKAYKGALNNTEGATLLGHAISAALSRANIEGAEVEDVVMGCAMQQGTTGTNIARKALLRAGLPVTVAGTTIDRQCASGLQAIALAARSVIFDGVEVAIGGGGKSISLVQNNQMNKFHAVDPELLAMKGDAYIAMLDTAEIVAKRYNISRERQDEYSLESQRRTAAAQQGGRFNDELAPIKTTMAVTDKATGAVSLSAGDAVGRRRAASRYHRRGSCRRQAGQGTGLHHHRRQCEPALGRRQCRRHHERQARRAEGTKAARYLPRLCRGGLRAGRDGGRSGLRRAAATQASRPEDRRYRSLGAERGICGAGDLLPRQARHRSGKAQRQWRLDRGRSSLWHDRSAADRPCPDRGPPAQGANMLL